MGILFLADREDVYLKSLFTYLSANYHCDYRIGEGDDDLLVSNCLTPNPQKTVYCATDPADYIDNQARRQKISFVQAAKAIICPSVYLARLFYERFRVKCDVQYPYFPESSHSPEYITYNPKFAAYHNVSELPDLSPTNDLATTKLYISGPGPFEFEIVEAAARGIPVVVPDDQWPKEFLQPGDGTFKWGTSSWVSAAKKCLRDLGTKARTSKFTNMATFNDKIRESLSKKTVVQETIARPTMAPTTARRRSGPNTNHARSTRPTRVTVPALSERTIYISGSCVGISGYDNLVYETIKGMRSVSLDVRINANNDINYNVCPAWFRDIHMGLTAGAWEVIITPPCNLSFIPPGKRSVVLTMWETDYLEPEWVAQLNKAHLVCVPSQWGVDCFRKCGVRVPIECVPLGHDPLIFNPTHDFPKTCTFGTAAALSAGGLRKNTKYIIDLFQEAFPTEDVRLKVKVSPNCALPSFTDDRVSIIREMLPPARLADWYRSITAFVNASYAEGFGLHLIEAMACGRPIVSTNYSAVTEYFDGEVGWIADHEIVPAAGGAYTGHWGKPVGDSLVRKMREVYENQEAAREKGENAYLRSRGFTWKVFGQKLSAALKRHGVIR